MLSRVSAGVLHFRVLCYSSPPALSARCGTSYAVSQERQLHMVRRKHDPVTSTSAVMTIRVIHHDGRSRRNAESLSAIKTRVLQVDYSFLSFEWSVATTAGPDQRRQQSPGGHQRRGSRPVLPRHGDGAER
jgi:hypothetical protein